MSFIMSVHFISHDKSYIIYCHMHVMSNVISCHMSCSVIGHVMLYFMSCHILSCHNMSCHVISCVMECHVICMSCHMSYEFMLKFQFNFDDIRMGWWFLARIKIKNISLVFLPQIVCAILF